MSNEMESPAVEGVRAVEPGPADLARVHDVPVDLAVEIGRTRMTIGETLTLGPGAIVALNRLAGEPVDLLVNGKPIARGEVVVIDEEFGLRVTEVVTSPNTGDEPAALPRGAGSAVPGVAGETPYPGPSPAEPLAAVAPPAPAPVA